MTNTWWFEVITHGNRKWDLIQFIYLFPPIVRKSLIKTQEELAQRFFFFFFPVKSKITRTGWWSKSKNQGKTHCIKGKEKQNESCLHKQARAVLCLSFSSWRTPVLKSQDCGTVALLHCLCVLTDRQIDKQTDRHAGQRSLDNLQYEVKVVGALWPCASKALFSFFCRLCCTQFQPASRMKKRLKVLKQHLARRCHTSHLCSERLLLGLRCRGHGERVGLLPAGLGANVKFCLSVIVYDPDCRARHRQSDRLGAARFRL